MPESNVENAAICRKSEANRKGMQTMALEDRAKLANLPNSSPLTGIETHLALDFVRVTEEGLSLPRAQWVKATLKAQMSRR